MPTRYLIILPHVWGKGESVRTAVARAFDSGYPEYEIPLDDITWLGEFRWDQKQAEENGYESTDDVDDKLYVDHMGHLMNLDVEWLDKTTMIRGGDIEAEEDYWSEMVPFRDPFSAPS